MNTMVNMPVEQLWYTWSNVGLGSVHAEFRVRAASQNLLEIYGPRVQSMDRYMRYDLPTGTDPFAITPEMAPVGLAFTRTDWGEYILVHKNYSGKDGVGRPGNFFIHVLALGKGMPPFSAEDAIWLWDADLWKTNDQSLKDRRSTTLDTIPSAVLDSNPRFRPQYAQVREALAFVIEAYLTRKEGTPLYIAAPAHQMSSIAYLIAGLTNCLPQQLLKGLTFSTYEPDITKATTGIVGTSWIAALGQTAEAVMPEQWYRDHLAINCATGEHSRLLGHPQINTNPLAPHFAAYAADCLTTDAMQQLEDLCELAEKSQALTVELFLQLYNDEIANAENISEVDVERNLTNADLYLDRLNSQIFRKKIIDCVLKNPQWGETRLAPILGKLRAQAERTDVSLVGASTYAASAPEQQQVTSLKGPQKSSKRKQDRAQTKKPRLTLALALAEQARRAIQEIVALMRQVAKAPKEGTISSSESTLARQQIIALIKVMDRCLTIQDPNEVWQTLFTTIIGSPSATAYLKSQWDIRSWLLHFWNNTLPITEEYDNAVRPLIGVPWSRFGKFLTTSLPGRHRRWLVFAVEGALADPSLTSQTAQELAQDYAKEIYSLLSLLLQDAHFVLAANLLSRLVEQSYKIRPPLDALIDQLLTYLNHDQRFWSHAKELVMTLTRAGYGGTASYQSLVETLSGNLLASSPAEGNALLDLLIEYKYPRKKALLDLLLGTGRADMERSIARVYRTPEEQNAFFLHDAAPFLQHRDTVQAMVSLYWELLRALPQDDKMERLFVLLARSLDETTLLDLLDNSSLTGNERVQLLQQFGSHYLTVLVARQAPRLAQRLLGWVDQLVQGKYTTGAGLLFHLLDPQIEPRYLEPLLKIASLSVPESQQLFKDYGRSVEYVPLFRQSQTALALFARFAKAVNSYKESSEGKQQLSKEKMDTVFAWLELSIPFNDQRAAGQILQAAALTQEEQITFLDTYGTNYLPLYQQLPILAEYVNTYIEFFNPDDLDRAETKLFFATLERHYQYLHLNEDIRQRAGHWLFIVKYLTSLDSDPEAPRKLGTALLFLRISLDASFTKNLARAFVFRIRTTNDLTTIMRHIESAPNVRADELRLLYAVAEQAATYYSQQAVDSLLPYLLFALTWSTQYRAQHFRHEFLDALLRGVQVTDLTTWRWLHTIVMQQPLPREAIERWEFYLDKLELLDQLNKGDDNVPTSAKITWPWAGKKDKQPEPVPASPHAAGPADGAQYNPPATKGQTPPHKQPRALDIRGSSSAANPSQGGASFYIQGKDDKKGQK